ncbi:MAG: AMP-binding protein, partial [Pseudomonas sp.]
MTDAFELPVTLVQALVQRAAQTPQRVALRFLADDPQQEAVLTYRDLDLRARTIAAALQTRTAFGDRAVLLFPSGPDYVAAFFGCLYAGVIAVPAYPPESSRRHHQERLLSIIDDAEPRLLLSTSGLHDSLQALDVFAENTAPQLLAVDHLDAALADTWQAPVLQADDIAFLQYTSGSTALPKGVQVSHGNLVANEVLIRHGFGIDLNPDDVIVSWLPLYHDMGLIGCLLLSLYRGATLVLMSPRHFVERPARWLEAISQYRATHTGAPDFAFRLAAERVNESVLATLDLSCLRVLFSGSEPVRQDSLHAFARHFAGTGFNPLAFLPCYGLAEATLFVSGGVRGQGIPPLSLDAGALAQNRAEPGAGSVQMSCGRSQP